MNAAVIDGMDPSDIASPRNEEDGMTGRRGTLPAGAFSARSCAPPPPDSHTTMRGAGNPLCSRDLLAMVAHELRTPIAAIQSALGVLAASGSPPATRVRTHALIERQLRCIARVSEDLLDSSYMATGKLSLRKSRGDLCELAAACLESILSRAGSARRELRFHRPVEEVSLEFDAERISQVITNLLDNALKHSAPDDVIELSILDLQEQVQIRVTDQGSGIAPEHLCGIFDLYVQAASRRGWERAGLGVGLYLVRQIVELHGGSVNATSAGPGFGSTLLVSLPRSTPPRPPCPRREP